MSRSSEASEILFQKQHQFEDKCLQQTRKKSETKKANRKAIWAVGVLAAVVLAGLFCTLFLFESSKGELPNREEHIQFKASSRNQMRLVIDSHLMDWTKSCEPSEILDLVINASHLTSFDTAPFTSLQTLTIQQNVKLDELVINNTQLVEFVYSSKQLKTVKLINNTKLVRFINSALPSVTHLYIVKTPVSQFKKNNLDSLQYLEFTDSKIERLHLLDTGVKNVVIQNCGNVETYPTSFTEYKKLETLFLSNSIFHYDTQLINMKHLRSVTVINSTFQNGLIFQGCSKLTELKIDTDHISELVLQDTLLLTQFYPRITTAHDIWLNHTGLSYFGIQTTELEQLAFCGNSVRKIQDNIPGLKVIFIQNSNFTDSQFSAIKAPNLEEIYIKNCSNIKTLNYSFPLLNKLQFIFQVNTSLALLKAPKLEEITFQGCHFTEINTINFPSLNSIFSQFSEIQRLNIQDPVQYVSIEGMQQATNIFLNSSELQGIIISQMANVTIQNSNKLGNLKEFDLESLSAVKIVGNNFGDKLEKFHLRYNGENIIFQNNTFKANAGNKPIEFDYSYNNVTKFNQYLKGIQTAQFQGSFLNDFNNIIKYTGEVRNLHLSKNQFSNVSGVQSENTTELIMGVKGRLVRQQQI